jgi:GrpB-like predicted nucleotidyltransferase (UPF0157 family)
MIGLKRGTVRLVRHSSGWRRSFETEKRKIRKIFGEDSIDVQHIGSTAIPGILSKPIIDIVLVVPSLKRAKCYVKDLSECGYELTKDDSRKERLFFTKGPEEKRTHHLHIGRIGSGYAENMIIFRDFLLKHKEIAKKYDELKKTLAEKYQNEREKYTEKKKNFVEKIVMRAKKVED